MATKYHLFVEGTQVADATRAKKEPVIKIGETLGLKFEVRTDTGTVVYGYEPIAAAPDPEPTPAKPTPAPAPKDDEDAEKPMTKGEAYAWFKRARAGLRDAERALEKGNVKQADFTEFLNDSLGAISEMVQVFDEDGNGINGVV